MGTTLARIVEVGAGPAFPPLEPLGPRPDEFEFVSHSSVFDFEATVDGAEWIEDYAVRAHTMLQDLPTGNVVAAHRDWRLGNVEVARGEVRAIYDWGSVAESFELDAVGAAAIGFGAWWGQDGRKGGTRDEAAVFVSAYEHERGVRFSADELQAAAAAAVLHLAYVARCEHSVGWPALPDLAQGVLAAEAPALLEHGFAEA